jgi:hypothetical protein
MFQLPDGTGCTLFFVKSQNQSFLEIVAMAAIELSSKKKGVHQKKVAKSNASCYHRVGRLV